TLVVAGCVAQQEGESLLRRVPELDLVMGPQHANRLDVLRLAPHVDGINIKLLKSGGLGEALLMARTARRLGRGVMLGCYSDGALLNGAAAQLVPLVRWPDLDSHLNLIDDPFVGLERRGDVVLPPAAAGIGVWPGPDWAAETPATALEVSGC
ncbi:MAG: hypothetical protein ACKOPS_17775, partial [Cyanobium sp.]